MMSIIRAIKEKLTAHHEHGCGCHHGDSTEGTTNITKDMIVKDVTKRWPQTVNVFGNHKLDFCCGGAHSIEQTANARGCHDIEALIKDLNGAVQSGRTA
jgi:hypothetical protein